MENNQRKLDNVRRRTSTTLAESNDISYENFRYRINRPAKVD